VVLGLILARSVHGFAVVRLLTRDGPLGRVYEIPRPVVYRSIDRLVDRGLPEPRRVEHGHRGPQRTVYGMTPRGRRELRSWLGRPMDHGRELRTEFLAKLALLERVNEDPGPLLVAQRREQEPIVAALTDRQQTVRDLGRTILARRYQAPQAAIRFHESIDGSDVRPRAIDRSRAGRQNKARTGRRRHSPRSPASRLSKPGLLSPGSGQVPASTTGGPVVSAANPSVDRS
jgi:PadR family transcriptional regulator AphA